MSIYLPEMSSVGTTFVHFVASNKNSKILVRCGNATQTPPPPVTRKPPTPAPEELLNTTTTSSQGSEDQQSPMLEPTTLPPSTDDDDEDMREQNAAETGVRESKEKANQAHQDDDQDPRSGQGASTDKDKDHSAYDSLQRTVPPNLTFGNIRTPTDNDISVEDDHAEETLSQDRNVPKQAENDAGPFGLKPNEQDVQDANEDGKLQNTERTIVPPLPQPSYDLGNFDNSVETELENQEFGPSGANGKDGSFRSKQGNSDSSPARKSTSNEAPSESKSSKDKSPEDTDTRSAANTNPEIFQIDDKKEHQVFAQPPVFDSGFSEHDDSNEKDWPLSEATPPTSPRPEGAIQPERTQQPKEPAKPDEQRSRVNDNAEQHNAVEDIAAFDPVDSPQNFPDYFDRNENDEFQKNEKQENIGLSPLDPYRDEFQNTQISAEDGDSVHIPDRREQDKELWSNENHDIIHDLESGKNVPAFHPNEDPTDWNQDFDADVNPVNLAVPDSTGDNVSFNSSVSNTTGTLPNLFEFQAQKKVRQTKAQGFCGAWVIASFANKCRNCEFFGDPCLNRISSSRCHCFAFGKDVVFKCGIPAHSGESASLRVLCLLQ